MAITLTIFQLLELRRALGSLDVVRAGKDGEFIPLEFDAKTRYRLMRASAEVEREALVFDKLERKLAEECEVFEGMEKNEANGLKVAAYNRKIQAAKEEVVSLDGIVLIRLTDLLNKPAPIDAKQNDRLRVNPLMQSVLNKLAPIIEEDVA